MNIKWIFFFLGVSAAWLRAASLVDTTFNPGAGANGIVEHVVLQPDGKILVCGNFTSFGGQDRGYVARLNDNGSVDMSFNAHPGYWVRHMSLQTDGKIVIGGFFTNVEGIKRNRIARLNADGSLDTSFDPGAGCEVIIAPGIDGNTDPFVMWTELQSDGKILACGNFLNYNGAGASGIVRINPDGSRDTGFTGGLNSWGRSIKVLTNGQILLTGWFTEYRGRSFNRIVRIAPDGTPDLTFNAFYGDKTAVYSIGQQGNGQWITSGHSLNEQGLFNREICRLNLDGTVDQSWVGSTNEKTEGILMQRDGKAIVVGYFSLANGVPRKGIARFNADGTLDPNLVANADNYVWTVVNGGAGKILVSGGFTTIDGIARGGVARLNLPEAAGTGGTATAPTIANARIVSGHFQCTVPTEANFTYVLQYKNAATDTTWNSLPGLGGTGSPVTLSDSQAVGTRFYRVEVR